LTGEVEERQGEPAAEDSIRLMRAANHQPGRSNPRKKLRDRKTGGESVYACATVLTVSCCHFSGMIYP